MGRLLIQTQTFSNTSPSLMPTRRLPRSDDERSGALNGCFSKYTSTDAADRLFTAAQFTALGILRGTWNPARLALGGLLSTQTSNTTVVETNGAALRRFVSHFIQVFNLAIQRGTFPRQSRAFYNLDVSNDNLPSLGTGAELLLWTQNLVDGEAARVLAGGAPMSMPAIGEIISAQTDYTTAEATQSTAKDAFDLGQEAVADQRPEADAIILDLWDTIEFNLRSNDGPSLRRKAREWGVLYVASPAPKPTGQLLPPTP